MKCPEASKEHIETPTAPSGRGQREPRVLVPVYDGWLHPKSYGQSYTDQIVLP